jgi:hypothetical protein
MEGIITMRDELFDRDYADGREALNQGIDRLLARFGGAVVKTIETLHRIQWAAPWDRDPVRH